MNMECIVKANGQKRVVLGKNPNGSLNLKDGKTLYIDSKNNGRILTRCIQGKFASIPAVI